MNYTEKDIKTIYSLIEELQMYRNQDEEPRVMATDGLYSDEIELKNKLNMILERIQKNGELVIKANAINKEWDEMTEEYIFTLDNGEKIRISEENYDTIMLHTSDSGRVYKANVDEHENEFEEPIEYVAFELVLEKEDDISLT